MGGLVPWAYKWVIVPGGDWTEMGYFSAEVGAFSTSGFMHWCCLSAGMLFGGNLKEAFLCMLK